MNVRPCIRWNSHRIFLRENSTAASSITTTTEDDEVQDRHPRPHYHDTSTSSSFSSSSSSSWQQHRPTGPLWDRYYDLIQAQDVHEDEHQHAAIEALERLRLDLLKYDPPTTITTKTASGTNTDISSSSGGIFGGWFRSPSQPKAAANGTSNKMSVLGRQAPSGCYLHGGVGCGKTFVMNLFFDSIQDGPWAREKQKVHFHKFMLQVHQDMHMARKELTSRNSNSNNKSGLDSSDAILPAVIQKTIQQGRLLCLDEFQVTDVADALILQRLFTGLWENGCVLVATSNRPPGKEIRH